MVNDYKSWYENGNLMVNCYYLKGMPEGKYQSWHGNGNLEIQGYFSQGQLIGDYQEGKLIISHKLLCRNWSSLSVKLIYMIDPFEY